MKFTLGWLKTHLETNATVNEIADNRTSGLLVVNYGFVNHKATDKKLDWFNEALNIHHNTFRHNGYKPPMLDINDASTTITASSFRATSERASTISIGAMVPIWTRFSLSASDRRARSRDCCCVLRFSRA